MGRMAVVGGLGFGSMFSLLIQNDLENKTIANKRHYGW